MDAFINECFITFEGMMYGFIVALMYDAFCIQRKVIHTSSVIVIIQDILFCSLAGVYWYIFLFAHSDREISIFYYVATFFAIYVYEKVFSKAVVDTISGMITYLVKKIKKKL